jgi:hypothetical protein
VEPHTDRDILRPEGLACQRVLGGFSWHYTYTQDRAFLKERVFEPLKEATLFVAD